MSGPIGAKRVGRIQRRGPEALEDMKMALAEDPGWEAAPGG